MVSSVVIGADALLGGYLIAHLLSRTDRHVSWILDLNRRPSVHEYERLVFSLLERATTPLDAATTARLHVMPLSAILERGANEGSDTRRPVDVWVLAGGRPLQMSAATIPVADDRSREALAAAALHVNPAVVHWVDRGSTSCDGLQTLCRWPQDVRVRSRRIGALVHPDADRREPHDDVMAIVTAIDDVVQGVRGRVPEYFEWHALKLPVAPDALLTLSRADTAAKALVESAERHDSTEDVCESDGAARMRASDICDAIGDAYEMSLIAVGADRALNAVDRLLVARLGPANPIFWTGDDSPNAAAATPTPDAESTHRLAAMIDAARTACDTARRSRDARVRATAARLDRRTVAVRGGTMTYYAFGTTGTPLVLLNALGQGLEYWLRLVDRLATHHRIFLWTVRGTAPDDPTDLRLADHAADVHAVIRQERLDRCCLVGWCNGPQVAVEFYRRWRTPVRGMVFLNPTFNLPQHSGLKTPFTEDNESLCHMVSLHPDLAPTIARSLSSLAERNVEQLLALDADTLADIVVRLTNRELLREVVRPFVTPEATIRYAAQVLDRLSQDTLAHAPRVDVPVLVVGCEHDQVASREGVRVVCERFPLGRYVELAGTHHALHEQAERLADLIATFAGELCEQAPTMAVGSSDARA